jgi:hypothetical protein
MKNLSHPHVVKLVGVCWSEDLFACLLEFVQNGSLEDWLRRTAGGKTYKPQKLTAGDKKKKKKKKKKRPSLADVTYLGFDHSGEYDPSEITATDGEKLAEAEALLQHWWGQRMNPKMGWEAMLALDESPLELGVVGVRKYDKATRCGMAVARASIDATPKQVFGLFVDERFQTITNHVIESSYTTAVELLHLPVDFPTISDRESLYRECRTKNAKDRSYLSVGYTITDERQPEVSGRVRVEGLGFVAVKELPGSEGERSEVFRLSRVDPKVSQSVLRYTGTMNTNSRLLLSSRRVWVSSTRSPPRRLSNTLPTR